MICIASKNQFTGNTRLKRSETIIISKELSSVNSSKANMPGMAVKKILIRAYFQKLDSVFTSLYWRLFAMLWASKRGMEYINSLKIITLNQRVIGKITVFYTDYGNDANIQYNLPFIQFGSASKTSG